VTVFLKGSIDRRIPENRNTQGNRIRENKARSFGTKKRKTDLGC
jgi:hypothetical protein